MTIEIINRGVLPQQRKITATCRNCRTEFSFQPVDATFVPDQRDGDYYRLACLVCHADCTIAAHRLAGTRALNQEETP